MHVDDVANAIFFYEEKIKESFQMKAIILLIGMDLTKPNVNLKIVRNRKMLDGTLENC